MVKTVVIDVGLQGSAALASVDADNCSPFDGLDAV